MLYTIKLA